MSGTLYDSLTNRLPAVLGSLPTTGGNVGLCWFDVIISEPCVLMERIYTQNQKKRYTLEDVHVIS